eukprot:5098227-Karenia_brevis.AAC.1
MGYGPGISAKEALGKTAPLDAQKRSVKSSLDPERVEVEDKFSFIYERGTRAGKRREVMLTEKSETDTGIMLVCTEKGKDGENNKYDPKILADERTRSA